MTNQTDHHAEAILRDAVPMAWQSRRMYADSFDAPGKIHQWQVCSTQEATGHFEKQAGYEYRPLYPASAILDAVQAERAAIVAWLRGGAGIGAQMAHESVLEAIERGEHLPQDKSQ